MPYRCPDQFRGDQTVRQPTMPRPARALAAALGTLALLGSACGQGAAAPVAADVPSAIVASLSGSVRTEVSLDAAADLDEVNALIAAFPELGGSTESDDSEIRPVLDVLDAVSLVSLKSDDGSGGISLEVNGIPAGELRFDLGSLATMTDFAELIDAEPFDASVLARWNQEAIGTLADLVGEELPVPDLGAALTLGLMQVPLEIPDSVVQMVTAFAKGEWAGVAGKVDVEALLGRVGLTRDEARRRFSDAMIVRSDFRPSAEELVSLLGRSVTFTAEGDAAGQARYRATLHTDVFVREVADLAARGDATGAVAAEMEGMIADLDVADIEDFMTITMDGDKITSARINLLTVMAEAASTELEPAREAEFRAAVRGLVDTRLALVLNFSEHGQIGNTLEGVSGTTASWDDLFGMIPDGFADDAVD